jgi:hypothetical protein
MLDSLALLLLDDVLLLDEDEDADELLVEVVELEDELLDS